MFKPTGAEDYAVDTLDVTVVSVEFDKEIVKAGISLINKDVRGTVKATITPKDAEGHITFDSTNLESFIRYPSGQLKGGVVQDLIADILFENKLILRPNQERLWREKRLSVKKNENGDLYVAPGGHYNIYLAKGLSGSIVLNSVQELWVHGHKIEDRYRRQIKISTSETNFGQYVTDTKE